MGKILLLVSMFTLACACWLAFMEMLLRHPGYAERIGVALDVALICAATILVRMLHVGFRGERWLWVGAAALIVFGAQAFFEMPTQCTSKGSCSSSRCCSCCRAC